jgi:hypothetical protein
MSPDSSFLQRNWTKIKTAVTYLINQDGNSNGILEGLQHTTLDDDWYGVIPWISGLYVAALRAASAMAGEMGDTTFASRCDTLATAGTNYLNANMWNAQYGYYIQKPDPTPHGPNTNHSSNTGSYIDQMFGQMYAAQLDLPRVFPADRARTALANLFRYNLVADPVGYRSSSPAGTGARTYAAKNEPGMIMSVWPFGVSPTAGSGWVGWYFNEVWTGMEYQAASHMMSEGLVDQSLAVVNAIHARYDATKRNPYNEIECSDHYARAMSSHGVFLAASGYAYHGPRGHLGFAPKITPESFQTAFTVAQGWGSYQQLRDGAKQTCRVDITYGQLKLSSLSFETAAAPATITVTLAGNAVPSQNTVTGTRVDITLANQVTVAAGQRLEVVLT